MRVNNFDEIPIKAKVLDYEQVDRDHIQTQRLPTHQHSLSDLEFQLTDMNMRQCPYCQRNFNEIAAERHIPICGNTRNRARPPPSK